MAKKQAELSMHHGGAHISGHTVDPGFHHRTRGGGLKVDPGFRFEPVPLAFFNMAPPPRNQCCRYGAGRILFGRIWILALLNDPI
jgi:hypothetical protein